MKFVKCRKGIKFGTPERSKIVWKEGKIYRIMDEVDGTYYVESEVPDENYGISREGFEECFTMFECDGRLSKECNNCKYLSHYGNLVQCFFNHEE